SLIVGGNGVDKGTFYALRYSVCCVLKHRNYSCSADRVVSPLGVRPRADRFCALPMGQTSAVRIAPNALHGQGMGSPHTWGIWETRGTHDYRHGKGESRGTSLTITSRAEVPLRTRWSAAWRIRGDGARRASLLIRLERTTT